MNKQWLGPCVYLLFLGAQVWAQGSDWKKGVLNAGTLQDQGRAGEAEVVLLNLLRDTTGTPPDGLALIYSTLGSATQDQGRFADAERLYRRSIALWETAGQLGRLGQARTLNDLASLLWYVGRLKEAESALEQSAKLHIEILGPDHPETTVIYSNLGTFQLRMRRWSEAERAFRQALGNQQPTANPSREVGWLYHGLGLVCRSTRRAEEADEYFRKAQSILEQHRSKGELKPLHLIQLAASYRLTNQSGQVEQLLRQAVATIEADGRMTPSEQAVTLTICANELKQLPQMAKEGREMEKRARQILAADTQLRMIRETIHVSGLMDDEPRAAPRRGPR
jgi:tetratricopeptide (TPR) repeat protein